MLPVEGAWAGARAQASLRPAHAETERLSFLQPLPPDDLLLMRFIIAFSVRNNVPLLFIEVNPGRKIQAFVSYGLLYPRIYAARMRRLACSLNELAAGEFARVVPHPDFTPGREESRMALPAPEPH